MAIPIGAEEQTQDPQLPAPAPTPERADPLGMLFWLSCRAWHI